MWRNKLTALALTLAAAPAAKASFLDTDFWCRTYGCVVVHDGESYDIYDNWQFATNSCCVPVGGEMIDFYVRAGTPNVTGTLTSVDDILPSAGEGMMLGISDDGGTVTTSILDNGNGYLDAGDALSAFTLNPNTSVQLAGPGQRYSHSFFISSRNTRFSIRARASLVNATGDFANTVQLGDIKLTPSLTTRGNDEGFDFGARANTSNITILNNVDDLGDLAAGPTQIMTFDRFSGIRQRNGDIDEQTIRLDLLYEMPSYDFSMGTGSLDIDVAFDFYREN
jgi:hypothetical protein